jgi:glucose/mannose-6-phosphate isomerase
MYDLDNPEVGNSFDNLNMKDILSSFANQYSETKKIAQNFDKIPSSYGDFKNIVFSGMGGSAIGGDLIRTIFSDECPIPIIVNRDYNIPKFVDYSTLFISASYSGNTEETISAFKQALDRSAKVIVISAGGELQKLAKENNVPYVEIEKKGLQPRCAFGYIFVPMVYFLSKLGLIPDQSDNFDETAGLISKSAVELATNIPTIKNKAKQLAIALYNKIPVIYAPQNHFDVVAMRWKGQINENSKAFAFCNAIPEMNHNEIVGWGIPQDVTWRCVVIILAHNEESNEIKKRIAITSSLIAETGAQIIEIQAEGNNPLTEALYLIYLGDMVSYYLAILNGVDPTPIERIITLKSMLSSR